MRKRIQTNKEQWQADIYTDARTYSTHTVIYVLWSNSYRGTVDVNMVMEIGPAPCAVK